jgi:hypothetical protein
MPALRPQLRVTETYTESNFLRLHTSEARGECGDGLRLVTLEHLCYRASSDGGDDGRNGGGIGGAGGWQCLTIVDREPMSKEDALFIARAYAHENAIPVIYECHGS